MHTVNKQLYNKKLHLHNTYTYYQEDLTSKESTHEEIFFLISCCTLTDLCKVFLMMIYKRSKHVGGVML